MRSRKAARGEEVSGNSKAPGAKGSKVKSYQGEKKNQGGNDQGKKRRRGSKKKGSGQGFRLEKN